MQTIVNNNKINISKLNDKKIVKNTTNTNIITNINNNM